MDATNLLALFVVALSAAAIRYHLKAFSYWSSRGIRGPRPWPLLGTAVYYLIWDKQEMDLYWREKYGRTYGVYDGYWPTLRSTDCSVIKSLWVKHFAQASDRDIRHVHEVVMKNWIFFSRGLHWTSQRVLVSPMFTSGKMRPMLETMNDCLAQFLAEIQSTRQSKSFDKDDLVSLTLDTIARSLFGLKLDTYRDKTSEFFKQAFAFSTFDFKRFIVWLFTPSPIAKSLKMSLLKYSDYEYFDKLTVSLLNERRKSAKKTRARSVDFLQALMEAKVEDEKGPYSAKEDLELAHYNANIGRQELERIHASQQSAPKMFRNFSDLEIRGQTTFFFIAGFETTASSITFCLYELAHQPAAQQEVYEEVRAVLARSAGDPDGPISYEQLGEMKKLDSFVSESLRMYAPVTSLTRMVTADEGIRVDVEGRELHLPKGMVVEFNGYVLQRDPTYWPDPDKFDMSRFLPENRDSIQSCTYMPFGVGPRNCAGMRFALMVIRLSIARLLLRFRLSPGPKSTQYPPKFNVHSFFLQLAQSDIGLEPRDESSTGQ